LLAGNAFWNLNLSISELATLAAEIGSDVSFFLHGGYAVCRGRGEIVAPIDNLPPIWVVIVKPPFGLATPRVYGKCKIPAEPCKIDGLLRAMRNRDEIAMAGQIVNRLWAPALEIEPAMAQLTSAFHDAGLVAHQMSGSGSSYFGLTFERANAIRAASILRSRSLGFTWTGRGGVRSGTENACITSPNTLSS
jgi:4-diphosphocytidyl-2-C-methyl-D-erythritol kinase